MRKSDQLSVIAVLIGIAAGLAMWYWFPKMPVWIDVLIGCVMGGIAAQQLLQGEANRRVIDSKTVNKR
jgi:hypothetical protein